MDVIWGCVGFTVTLNGFFGGLEVPAMIQKVPEVQHDVPSPVDLSGILEQVSGAYFEFQGVSRRV